MYAIGEGLDVVLEEEVGGSEEGAGRLEGGVLRLKGYGSERSRERWAGVIREAAPAYAHGGTLPDVPAEISAEISAETEVEDPEDELLLLGEACARTYLKAEALHYKAMKLLAEFHAQEGWRDTSFPSTAEWFAWRVGIQLGPARERLRTAVALQDLPQSSEAMATGRLSYAKARALTRVATPETENVLLDLAYSCSAAHLERIVRAWKTLDRRSEITAEQIRHRSRRFSAFVDDDGMVVVRGRLDPEVGALLMRAVEAASDALFRAEDDDTEEEAQGGSGQDGAPFQQGCESEERDLEEPTPEQRRADAVGLLAERALVAGFGEEGSEVRGTRADRYQVMLHVEMDTLTEDTEAGTSELEDGTRVSAETSRRLACDCGVVTITRRGEGEVVGASARKRTVSPSLRRALAARDRGCRFPGCGSRFTEAHHVKHWADGGETSLRNLVCLCRRHHRVVHEGGVTVCIDRDGQVVFFTRRGKVLLGMPPAHSVPVDEGDQGPELELFTGTPRYKRDSDMPWEVEARVWEALDPA
jgi:hypothetical protein